MWIIVDDTILVAKSTRTVHLIGNLLCLFTRLISAKAYNFVPIVTSCCNVHPCSTMTVFEWLLGILYNANDNAVLLKAY